MFINEQIDPNNLTQIRWRCRRGMKELDILFERYVANHLHRVNEDERNAFVRMLSLPDSLLWDYVMDRQTPTDSGIKDVLSKIRTP